MNTALRCAGVPVQIVHYPSAQEALNAEQSLVDQFKDPSVLYRMSWWTTEQCLVAPRSLKRMPKIEQAMLDSKASGWPVFFRHTGGDLTPQGPGVLNIALAFALDPSEKPSISGVYQIFCSPLLRWLSEYGCIVSTGHVDQCFCDGEYNIVVDELKVAGTAQRWTRVRGETSRQIVFAHALVLIDSDLNAGVNAINRLYGNCEMERTVQVDVHTNLTDVLHKPAVQVQGEMLSRLPRLYEDELIDLTL